MSTPVKSNGRVLPSMPVTPGSPGEVTTKSPPPAASPAVMPHTGRDASMVMRLADAPLQDSPPSPASSPQLKPRERSAQNSPHSPPARADAAVISPTEDSPEEDSPFTESSSEDSDIDSPVRAQPGLIVAGAGSRGGVGGSLPDVELEPDVADVLKSANPIADLHVAYSRYGIPLNEETMPALSYDGELGDFNRVGGGTTGQAYMLDDDGDPRVFKPCTGEYGLGGQVLGLTEGAPNLEGRSLLACGVGDAFFPKHCPASVPQARMAIVSTSQGNILGMDMSFAPGKAHLAGFIKPVPLDRNCTAYACLLPLRDDPELQQLQCKVLGAHRVEYRDGSDGQIDIVLHGQALRYPDDVLRHPDFKRGMIWLQLFDLIMGQCDRHSGNIMVDATRNAETGELESVSITGIDNDLCCGLNASPTKLRMDMNAHGYGYFVSLFPELIDTEMLEAVMSLDPDGMKVAGEHYLGSEAHGSALRQRLINLQAHCQRMRPTRVIKPSDWSLVNLTSASPRNNLAARETINAAASLMPGPDGLPPKVAYQSRRR